MSDTHETISDICAEMRDRSDTVIDGRVITERNLVPQEAVDDWADRIEAAEKRKRASLEDALANCKQYAQKIERENEDGETRLDAEEIIATVDNEFAGIRPERAPGNAAAMRAALEESRKFLLTNKHGYFESRLIPQIDAALSAPARNCDKYGIDDIKEMDADFGVFCQQYGAKDGKNCVGCPIKPMDNLCCHSAWMLLTEKGGAE